MSRCRGVHDLAHSPFRILRCSLEQGHRGNCKPKAWEAISEAKFKAFSKRLKRTA